MTNSVDPDQLASSGLDLHCLQRQGISRFSRTRVKVHSSHPSGGGLFLSALVSFMYTAHLSSDLFMQMFLIWVFRMGILT